MKNFGFLKKILNFFVKLFFLLAIAVSQINPVIKRLNSRLHAALVIASLPPDIVLPAKASSDKETSALQIAEHLATKLIVSTLLLDSSKNSPRRGLLHSETPQLESPSIIQPDTKTTGKLPSGEIDEPDPYCRRLLNKWAAGCIFGVPRL